MGKKTGCPKGQMLVSYGYYKEGGANAAPAECVDIPKNWESIGERAFIHKKLPVIIHVKLRSRGYVVYINDQRYTRGATKTIPDAMATVHALMERLPNFSKNRLDRDPEFCPSKAKRSQFWNVNVVKQLRDSIEKVRWYTGLGGQDPPEGVD